MKKALFLIAIVMVALSMAVVAEAATVAPQVNVSATVQGTCRVITDPGAMSFDIDPAAAGPIAAVVATQPTIRCTNGKTAAVSATSTGSGNTSGTGSVVGTLTGPGSFNYTFTFSNSVTGTGHGAGKDVSLGVGGSAAAADYADAVVSAAAGDYTDTVTLTVTY